jgi:hypothetical protein
LSFDNSESAIIILVELDMSNPFPGMDPYLEGPLWSTFHNSLIEEIARQLTPKLRPKYRARSAERIVIAAPDPIEMGRFRPRLPDVGVFGRPDLGSDPIEAPSNVVLNSPLILELAQTAETFQTFVEIRTASGDQLVTAIELLSPSNKRGAGAGEFQQKRSELLASAAHYLEIDLLRIGERFSVTTTLPSAPYFIFLSREGRRPYVEAWPIALDAVLPIVPIPLADGDPDIHLDLNLAFRTVYDLYEYDRDIDYSQSPVVELSSEQQTWADERLKAVGRR